MSFTRNGVSTTPPIPLQSGLDALFQASMDYSELAGEKRRSEENPPLPATSPPPPPAYDDCEDGPIYSQESHIRTAQEAHRVEHRKNVGLLRQRMSGVNTHLTQVMSKAQELNEDVRVGQNKLELRYKAVKARFPELATAIKGLKSIVIDSDVTLQPVTDFFTLWEKALIKQRRSRELTEKIKEYEDNVTLYRNAIDEADALHKKNTKMFEGQIRHINSHFRSFQSATPSASCLFDDSSRQSSFSAT